MLKNIITFSVNNKLIVGLMVLALIVYGSFELKNLPIDAVPDITNNQVQVIAVAPSYGAGDIERLITFPIEQASSNIPGIKEIRSFSRFGLSLVTIVFDDKIDIYWARQQVNERIQQVRSKIPAEISDISIGPLTTGLGEIYQYIIRTKPGYENRYSVMDLRTIQDWIVRRQLLGIKGVADVSSFGGKLKQYEIEVSPEKLHAYKITADDIYQALAKNNQNTGGSYIEKGPTVLYIRSEGLISSTEDIEKIAIKTTDQGKVLCIGDMARVKIGFATRYGAICYNDRGEVAGAVVMMLKGANSNKVVELVKERIKEIQKTLPEGVVLEAFLDRSKMVNHAIGTVEKNLLEGALIVLLVLVLFLGNMRAGFLVASIIPLAMLFAVVMMNLFGVSGNLMSLGALDFGLIVDGAVIIVEAVLFNLSHLGLLQSHAAIKNEVLDDTVKSSAGKMMNSAVFGQLIILVVYLPIFSLEGIEGKMFKPMAQTVIFALTGAFILSLTYLPMMSALMLRNMKTIHSSYSEKLMHRLENIYISSLGWAFRRKRMIMTFLAIIMLVSIWVGSRLGGEFIPTLEEGDFAVETRVLTGSNLNTTIEASQKASHILMTHFPEVEKVVTKIGSGEIPTDPMPVEAADLMIILKDKSEWKSAKTFNELAEKMQTALSELPGVTFGFQYPVQMRFNELMTGAKQDVVCKIYGDNLDSLAHYAGKLSKMVATVEGAKDIYEETVGGQSQIVVAYNRMAMAQYGLAINDLNSTINMAFAGQSTGLVYEGEKRFEMVVRLEAGRRKSIEDVRNLLIALPAGGQIPLSHVAEVELKLSPNQIQRDDAKRRIMVGFNVRGRDVQTLVDELKKKIDKRIKLPEGYFVTYGGTFENLVAAKQRLALVVPVSLVLIFILLFFAFKSMKDGLLIFSAIPLSAVGGIFSLSIRDLPFSISAGVGFIALFGVAVLNGIVLIAEFKRLRTDDSLSLKQVVFKGTKTRLRPVMITALVASLGFLPMALSNGAGAEVQRPLATVVIGGLISATFLTLYFLPILYTYFNKQKNHEN